MPALLLCLVLFAPAPMPRPAVRPEISGPTWRLDWHGMDGICEFRKGGIWWCWWQGKEWTGTWRMDGDTLHVDEWIAGRNEWDMTNTGYRWSATMEPGKLTGRTGSGGVFGLRKMK